MVKFSTGLIAVFIAFDAGSLDAQGGCCDPVDHSIGSSFKVRGIHHRRFQHADLWNSLTPYVVQGVVRPTALGRSYQGRDIFALDFGDGPVRVLLWSQMHGDESTATMALADIVRFFTEAEGHPLRELIRERLTVTMVPMLNPDGAQVFRRHNALGVDVNRDARRLATPEGRILKSLRDSIQPHFGFNLHDQSARNTVGRAGEPVAIALLAPAAEQTRAYAPVRARARRVAAVMATALSDIVGDKVAKYDDTFNARAFGDLIQAWGTSTVLVESGSLPNDPEKQELRRVNVTAILTALEAIATDRLDAADPDRYESLPFNYRMPNDYVVRGGRVVVPGGQSVRLDIALVYDDPVGRTGLRIGEVGDLDGVPGMESVDATGLFVHVMAPSSMTTQGWRLVRGERAAVVIRTGESDASDVVRRVPK